MKHMEGKYSLIEINELKLLLKKTNQKLINRPKQEDP